MRRSRRPLCDGSRASSGSAFAAIPFEGSASFRLIQRFVALEPPAHLLQRVVDQPRNVGLRKTQLLGDLLLRSVEKEAEEDDPALAAVECPGGPGDERAGERHVVQRLPLVYCVVL